MEIQSLAGAWEFRQAGAADWLPARVPGGVHTDLLALGRIPDPFRGDNERRLRWVAEADWEYRRFFDASPDLLRQPQVWLVCDGLDTLASVSLNGHPLGRAENMFRQYRWDVRPLLRAGGNELHVAFDSPVRGAARLQADRPLVSVPQALPGGPHLRKAPCQFGWDWGPQLAPIGIWKDIRLEGYPGARLAEVRFGQHHADDGVTVEARIAVQGWDEAPRSALLRLEAPDGKTRQAHLPLAADGTAALRVKVPDPRLWWPNGYGDQPLYRAEVELYQADSLADRHEVRLGLRRIELRQEADEWGRSFRFVVNGVPVFAKGSNWIPADSFPTRLTEERLEALIRSAADSHQNMLRVWGGGFYEDERFYDLCDRYGLLVWQEFVFACSLYPLDDPAFLENVRQEVVENVRRLRHRACLALWCGNNEMEEGWVYWGWDKPEHRDLKAAYERFFHATLPAWCAAEDPDRPYWPSSPSSGLPFEDPNGQRQGDAHYWEVWHGRKPFSAYRDQLPRFMSEFGFQALPPLATIRSFAGEDDWNLTSYVMECHQKNARGNSLILAQMLDAFRLPHDFESLVYLSQVLQAEGIRYGVEHWRRHPRRVAGTLYWQLDDCWPVASWSSLDYSGRWKALHYAARRFYAPLLLSIEDRPDGLDVYVTNDRTAAWQGSLRWSLERLDGRVLESGEEPVTAPPGEAALLRRLDFSARLDDDLRRETVFVAELWQAADLLSRQTAYFAPSKHLALTDPGLSVRLGSAGGQVRIGLACKSLARLVELALGEEPVVFSDNYFDLPAGRSVEVRAPLPAGWTLRRARAALRVRSVYNTYAHGPTD